MLTYPNIDPVAFHIGPLAVHWYGLMYLVAFTCSWGITAIRIRTSARGFTLEELSDILFYFAMGVILGGRLGYMIFYDWYDCIHYPYRIVEVWKGGMSFHGGLLGVTIALSIYAYKKQRSLLDIGDLVAPAIPLGLAIGRIGNFINAELWGRVTDVPWAMIFPNAGDLPRHPSQLYEALLEGLFAFVILWLFSQKPKPLGAVSGLFLILYGMFRIFVEFFREPDPQIGYLALGWFTEGQLLSIPMILAGMFMMTWAYRRRAACDSI